MVCGETVITGLHSTSTIWSIPLEKINAFQGQFQLLNIPLYDLFMEKRDFNFNVSGLRVQEAHKEAPNS